MGEDVHVQSTFAFQMLQNKSDLLMNDKLLQESNECDLNEPKSTDTEKNGYNILSSNILSDDFQRETYNGTKDGISKKSVTPEKAKKLVLLQSSTPISEVRVEENNAQNIFNESTVSSRSSSNEEVLQTRFTVENKNIIYQDEHNSNNNSPASERLSDNDNTSEIKNTGIKKTSPIIIQAIAFTENNAITDNNKLNSEINLEISNNLQTVKTDTTSSNSLSVEGINSHIETGSNYVQNAIENETDSHKNGLSIKWRIEMLEQEMMESVPEIIKYNSTDEDLEEPNDLSAEIQHLEEPNDISAETIIHDFLNGSFDVSTYQTQTRSSQNVKGKVEVSERQFSNEIMHTGLNNHKIDFSGNSHNTSSNNLKRKKRGRSRKDSKKARTTAKENKKDIIPEKPKESKPQSKLRNKYSSKKRQKKQILNHDENIAFNNTDERNVVGKKNKIKSNAARKRNIKNGKMLNAILQGGSPIRHSRREKRNSSLIASRKIKEIKKLESSRSIEEIIIDSSDEKSVISDDIYLTSDNNKNADIDLSQTEKTKMHPPKNKGNDFQEKNISKINSSDSVEFYSLRTETEKSRVTQSNAEAIYKKMYKDIFNICRITVKSPLKNNNREIKKDYFTNDTNLSGDHFMPESENFIDNIHGNTGKVIKRNSNKDSENVEKSMLDIGKNTLRKTALVKNVHNVTYKGSTPKTWDMLENELLRNSDDTPLINNICKTAILNKELVTKRNVKDSDLYTVCDISMLQTTGKLRKENMQNEIQNTKNKYLDTAFNKKHEYLNTSDNTKCKEIIPRNSKNMSIVERTIAAMEKCTAQFIAPQVNVIEDEQKQHTSSTEDQSDNSEVNQHTQFHSMTFMANENKQYYRNEIFGYMQKSMRRKKSNSFNTHNISEILDDCSEDMKYENFDNAEHPQETNFVTKSCLLEDDKDENIKNDNNQAVVPLLEQKDNPWEQLAKKIELEQNSEKGIYTKDNFNFKESTRKKISKLLVSKKDLRKTKSRYSSTENKVSATVNSDEGKINKQNEIKVRESEKNISKWMQNKETKELTKNTLPYCSTIADSGPKNKTDKEPKLGSLRNLKKPTEETKKNEKKKSEILKIERPSKFKLQIAKDGGLKFKKHSSRSSSITDSSGKFMHLRQTNEKHLKRDEYNRNKNNKGREKYKKYLKKVFDKEDTLLKGDMTSDGDRSIEIEKKDKRKFTENEKRNQTMEKKLIAKNEEDVFSLSSDSESDNDKNQGSGLLCELFDG